MWYHINTCPHFNGQINILIKNKKDGHIYMTSGERKKYILKTAAHDGIISIPEIAAHYGVSVETIRRDVNALCNENKLTKVHGGAVPVKTQSNSGKIAVEETYTVGSYAASLIKSGDVVMFDSGEEAQAVAAEVVGVKSVTFITNSVAVASILMKKHSSGDFSGRIILIGGELDPKYSFSRSPDTLNQIAKLRANKAFITASGVTVDGVYSGGTYESSFSAAMMEHSKSSVLVCESEKFGRDSLAKFAPLTAFSSVVTDGRNAIPSEIAKEIEKNGKEFKVVGTK